MCLACLPVCLPDRCFPSRRPLACRLAFLLLFCRVQDKRIAMVVTTEMAARGLDVAHLTHVVNYDLPTDADHYVHRAGRCEENNNEETPSPNGALRRVLGAVKGGERPLTLLTRLPNPSAPCRGRKPRT